MAGPRAEKVAVVEEVKGRLDSADAAILTEYRGLKVADLANLRRALRSAGAEYKIYKNTLVRRATAEVGSSAMDSFLEGPTGIAFVEADVAAVAKVLRDFARTHPALVVKGSYVSGSVLDATSTGRLADLPSREVLLAQIAGALAAPMQQFAALLKALPQNLAYGISAVIDQKRAGGDTSGDAAPAERAPAEPAVDEPAPAASAASEEPADGGATASEESPTDQATVEESPAEESAVEEPTPAASAASDASEVAATETETAEVSATEADASAEETSADEAPSGPEA